MNKYKEYLGNKCAVCGTEHNLEFDHVDPSTKEFVIGQCWSYSWEVIKPELDKCQLLCYEHHREKHAPKHGTISAYKRLKCRCEDCRKANSLHHNEYRYRKGLRKRPVANGESSNGSDLELWTQ